MDSTGAVEQQAEQCSIEQCSIEQGLLSFHSPDQTHDTVDLYSETEPDHGRIAFIERVPAAHGQTRGIHCSSSVWIQHHRVHECILAESTKVLFGSTACVFVTQERCQFHINR